MQPIRLENKARTNNIKSPAINKKISQVNNESYPQLKSTSDQLQKLIGL